MNINPNAYKDLVGKTLISAYLSLGNGKGSRVENIKEATFEIVRGTITKIEILEQKNNWKVIAYFDKLDRFYKNAIVVCKKGDLRGMNEGDKNIVSDYTYYENEDDYYCGGVAEYKTLDEGQTDDEIRAILEEKVKAQFEKKVLELEERIAWLKTMEEGLKKFIK